MAWKNFLIFFWLQILFSKNDIWLQKSILFHNLVKWCIQFRAYCSTLHSKMWLLWPKILLEIQDWVQQWLHFFQFNYWHISPHINTKLWAIVTFYKLNHIRPTWYQIKASNLSFQDWMRSVGVWSLVLMMYSKKANFFRP